MRLRRRPSKYGAVPTVLDGVRFDSKREAMRYAALQLLERARLITELERQPVFPLYAARASGGDVYPVGVYKADFRYRDVATGAVVVEDVKSPATQAAGVYRLKKRMVEAAYGIVITEVGG